MLEAMTDGVGAVACSMRMLDRPDLMDSAGGTIDELGHTMDRGFGRPASGYEERCDVLFPCGGAFLLRRSALEGRPLFWEDLDIYGEDADLGWRLWRTGWSVVYEPGATTVHHHSHTLGKTPGKKEHLLARNRVMLLRRHLGRNRIRRLLPWLMLWQFARVLKNLLLLRPALAWALLSGMTAGLFRPVERLRLPRDAASALRAFLPEDQPGGGLSGFVRRRARRALLL
jgi:GT2 family glycosyltransferase